MNALVGAETGAGHRARQVRAARADDFFRGKSISIVIGFSAGGDYEFRARLLARHMDRHIEGTPVILARNMPGAGGVAATTTQDVPRPE